MNEAEEIIQDLVADLPPAEQQAAREILRSCKFQDGNDPTLVLLRYLQVREKSAAETTRAKAGYLARIADELNRRLYEVARIKLAFVFILFLATLILSFVLGVGLLVYEARMHPRQVSAGLGLADPRLAELQREGVDLEVKEQEHLIGVCLTGRLETVSTNKAGNVAVIFSRQP